MDKKKKSPALTALMSVLCILFLLPILIVVMNSFKGKLFISTQPFSFPSAAAGTFVGLENYVEGIKQIGFWSAFGNSVFITVCSVLAIVLLTAMTGWFITRVKNTVTKVIYYLLVFSMIVPFQMVMFLSLIHI